MTFSWGIFKKLILCPWKISDLILRKVQTNQKKKTYHKIRNGCRIVLTLFHKFENVCDANDNTLFGEKVDIFCARNDLFSVFHQKCSLDLHKLAHNWTSRIALLCSTKKKFVSYSSQNKHKDKNFVIFQKKKETPSIRWFFDENFLKFVQYREPYE